MKVILEMRSNQGNDKESDPLSKHVAHIAKFAMVLIFSVMARELYFAVLGEH